MSEPETSQSDAPTERLAVVIADDDALARAMVSEVVANAPTLDLVGVADDAASAVELAAERKPDVVVLDWMMPGGGGPQASRDIIKESPGTQIVALTASDSQEASVEMLRAGAKSILIKGTSPDEIVRTIHRSIHL